MMRELYRTAPTIGLQCAECNGEPRIGYGGNTYLANSILPPVWGRGFFTVGGSFPL